ncbi:response regulator transcription factor [Zoogloeaceae bacterium G21618-S1]|uniref:response regulator transcription factor n=1 Tax=Denitromonas halophila TaxID=1629404 RepID=UPI001C924616|nr:response regulator transcription factor [Denitromonas halophila]MCZ4303919.1 response regulator transcription factor [Zoogloeaceae bacterium G21618-S1]
MRLAILEDDTLQSDTLADWLRQAGHDVHVFSQSRDFIRVAGRESFDLCLIDWMLPEMTGTEVLHWLREDRANDTPVIFITARDAEEDIVTALGAGADDYLVKPLRRFELLSRIDAVMRRARPQASDSMIEVPPFSFDVHSKRVTLDGEPVELTDKEFDLAAFLFKNLGRLLSRGHMLEAVWGRNPNLATRTVDTHISRVRSKLGLRPENGFRLTPTYNYGYRLEQIDAAEDAAD